MRKSIAATSRKAIQTDHPNVLYGYEIQRRLELPESDGLRTQYKDSGIVTKPKLLLDDNAHLGDLKADLRAVLQQLRAERVIKKETQVIEDLLSRLLGYTKFVLQRDHGLTKTSSGQLHCELISSHSANDSSSRSNLGCACLLVFQVERCHE